MLIDVLPEEKLSAVHGLLEVLVEPLSRSLAMAPVEDEDLTPETAAALDRARASLARGEGVSHEEVLREFGLCCVTFSLHDLRGGEICRCSKNGVCWPVMRFSRSCSYRTKRFNSLSIPTNWSQ